MTRLCLIFCVVLTIAVIAQERGNEAVWSTRYRDHFRGAHSDASPALLCHKEPAQGTHSPLLGTLLQSADISNSHAASRGCMIIDMLRGINAHSI